jgi:hypothetical protein
LINRPVRIPSREFILAQADKCEKFLKVVRKLTKDVPNQVDRIVNNFRRNGLMHQAIEEYNKLDKTIYEAIIAAAKKTIHKIRVQEVARSWRGRIESKLLEINQVINL